VDRQWVQGRAADPDQDGTDGAYEDIAEVKARSLSPKRLSMEKIGKSPDPKLQKFIHQFIFAVTGRVEQKEELREESSGATAETDSRTVSNVVPSFEVAMEVSQDNSDGVDVEEEDQGFSLVAVSGPTDAGKPLEDWLVLLTGSVVDVAANGNCGWLAFFAALYNESEGLAKPSVGVVKKSNVLKTRVINEMLANLADEVRLHPDDMRAEARALGGLDSMTPTEKL
jgi:hypothetical protein